MVNIKTKTFNEIEYIKIGDIHYLDNIYSIYIDVGTKTKSLIFQDDKLVENKDILNKVALKVFSHKTHTRYNHKKEADGIIEGLYDENTITHDIDNVKFEELSENVRNKLIEYCKRVFFKKFGKNILTEEELLKRINDSLRGIIVAQNVDLDIVVAEDFAMRIEELETQEVDLEDDEISEYIIDIIDEISEDILDINDENDEDERYDEDEVVYSAGAYDMQTKNIYLLLDENKKFNPNILFHEFIHSITPNGAEKTIQIQGLDIEFEYGESFTEGIVSYIENMDNAEEFFEPEVFYTYDEERNIIGIINILYDNIKKTEEPNFIESFIKSPGKTLSRFYKIIENDEMIKQKNISAKDAKYLSIKKGIRFVINMDKLETQREQEDLDGLEKNYGSLMDMLFEMYQRQIESINIESTEELYNILYQIEAVGYYDSEFDTETLYKTIIKNAKKNIEGLTIGNIIKKLPKKVKDTPKTSENEEDDRYEYIMEQLEEIKAMEESKKGKEPTDD